MKLRIIKFNALNQNKMICTLEGKERVSLISWKGLDLLWYTHWIEIKSFTTFEDAKEFAKGIQFEIIPL